MTALKKVLAVFEVIAVLACIYFGYLWYIQPSGKYGPLFAITTLVFVVTEFIWRYAPSRKINPEKLAAFILEGRDLRDRLNEEPLPIREHNNWVERMICYFKQYKGHAYEARLSDFSGMIFYGDGSERSKMSRSIDGRLRRLHEFISELGSK